MANSHLATKMKLGSMQSRQAAQAVKKALEEDPTVFQYDEVYDDMERDRTEKKEQAKGDRKPKYMNELMKAAERRKRENERRIEVQVQKDLEKEGDMYKDKEAFVTGAYKRKMEELKRIEEEERRQDAIDELTDVSKQKDLSGFYRHLYRTTMNEEKEKPKCEVKKTAADSSSDVTASDEKKSSLHDDEETNLKAVGRRDSSSYEREEKRKSHSSSHKESDVKDYHRDRSEKDRSSHRHHHHHHHRDRSRSRDRDRKRDRDIDRHRDREYDRKDKDKDRRDRDRDRDDRNKYRDRDRDRDHDKRRERDHHRYHPYARRESGKSRKSRSRSPPPARKQSSHQSSKPIETNGTKENPRNSSQKALDATVQAARTLKHINEHPVWRKRTIGDTYNDALERYLERKRSGLISAEIYKER